MIGIVILNYENWQDTFECIRSIALNPPSEQYRIILVDNASAGLPGYDLESFLETYRVVFIRNDRNAGYSAGNNAGIRKAQEMQCSYILVANSDVVFRKNSIQVLCDFLKRNPDVGIAGPKVTDPDGNVQDSILCRKTGMREKYLVRTRAGVLFRKEYRSYFGLDRNRDREFPVYAVLGCCFMMSGECAREVTPFDEYPFLYEEELILGMKMEQKHLVTMYCPGAVVAHVHGGSTKSAGAFCFAHNVRSEIYYCRNYLNASRLSIYPLYWYRTCSYLARCLRHAGFRKGWGFFRRLTAEELGKIPGGPGTRGRKR